MRKVFLDEDVEPDIEFALRDFQVESIAKLKMQSLQNGALLRWLAAHGYDVLVTKDKNIPFQNPLRKIGIAVLTLRG